MTNDITAPKGIPISRKPSVKGIVEHAQNGVSDPTNAPTKLPNTPLPDIYLLIFS